ncbi:MAG: cob(I)alamin adenosyltransferase [Bacteriovoracaceae bacterium]
MEDTEGICKMKKSAVYTRSGDKGQTSLVSGARILKSDNRIHLYGEVDELNSHIGFIRSLLEQGDFSGIDKLLIKIQSSLFDMGSKLACENENWEKYKLPDISEELIKLVEDEIDKLDSILPKMKNFILPSGSMSGSYMHIGRTVCRRVERSLVSFEENGNILPENALQLINRLSDYLFVASRFVNYKLDKVEIPWNEK